MAALASGILLKLINEMNSGGAKATSGHRSSLLQVTDILPADLDEKSLFPEHGFYLKVSDSSHSIYASLPSDQEDFVLSNKVQLGQFIYVDRLKPGSPVPVIMGAKPLPGRHPLVRTTEPIVGMGDKADMIEPKPVSRRGSWATGQGWSYDSKPAVPKSVRADIDENDQSGSMRKPPVRTRSGGGVRASFGGGLSESPSMLRKSCATALVSCSGKEDRVFRSFNSGGKPAQLLGLEPGLQEGELMNLPASLSLLSKEAVQWQETTRKMALRALREATTMETLVFSLGLFSRLIETARADAPATCFDRFLEFHQHIVRATTDMEESIQAADDNIQAPKPTELTRKILKSSPTTKLLRQRRGSLTPAIGKLSLDPIKEIDDENVKPAPNCHLSDTIELGKKIEAEASKWFMNFLEMSLESGFKKSKGEVKDGLDPKIKVSQSLILKVINWIEVQHCDSTCIKQHQRAAQISSKLRMKMKTTHHL